MENLEKRNAGFTLIELMVVVAVIAILAVIAIPKFADLISRSREANAKNSLATVRSGLSIYYGDNGLYPADLTHSLIVDQKYLKEIPSIEIPAVGTQGNPGHLRIGGETLTPDDMATGAFYYNPADIVGGEIMINCFHLDVKGEVWSSY